MKNRKMIRFSITISAVFLLFFSNLPALAQRLDTLHSLKEFYRHTALGNFVHQALLQQFNNKADSRTDELKNVSEWVRKNGNKADREVFEATREIIGIELQKKTVENQIIAAEKYLEIARKSNNNFLLFYLYHYISDRARMANLQHKSIENSLYCLDELKKDPEGAYYKQTWVLYQMAMDFYKYKDYKKAQELSTSAFRYYKSKDPNGDWFVQLSSDLAGMTYLKDGKFDSARKWLDITLKYTQSNKDPGWSGIATGNIATIYYLQKKYNEAIPLYEKAIAWCRVSNVLWDNVSPFCSNLADCYIQTGNKAAVPEMLAQAAAANLKDTTRNLSNFLQYYKIAANWYRNQDNTILALQYTDSADLYQKKLDEEFNILKKTEAEAGLAYRNKELENLLLKQEEKKTKLTNYLLMSALLILVLISILFFKRQKLQHQLRKEKLENETLMAREELNLAMTEIKDFTWHIREKNKLIESYAEEIEKLKKGNTTISAEELAPIEALQNATALTDKEWAAFQRTFEKVHPGYLQKLKRNYPDLSVEETQYLVFTKLHISFDEMAGMLGTDAEVVQHILFSLKQKLSVDDRKELDIHAADT
jgi:hypothetical protein